MLQIARSTAIFSGDSPRWLFPVSLVPSTTSCNKQKLKWFSLANKWWPWGTDVKYTMTLWKYVISKNKLLVYNLCPEVRQMWYAPTSTNCWYVGKILQEERQEAAIINLRVSVFLKHQMQESKFHYGLAVFI